MIGGISIGTVSSNATGGAISVVGTSSFPNINNLTFLSDFFTVNQNPLGQANVSLKNLFIPVEVLPIENIQLQKIYILPDGSWNYFGANLDWVTCNVAKTYDNVLSENNSTQRTATHTDNDKYLSSIRPEGILARNLQNLYDLFISPTQITHSKGVVNQYTRIGFENPTTPAEIIYRNLSGTPALLSDILPIVSKSTSSNISTTSLTALDINLGFYAGANECWYVVIDLNSGLGGTGYGGKYQINAPLGSEIEGGLQAQNNSAVIVNQKISSINTLFGPVKTQTLAGYLPDRIWYRLKTGATPGNVKFAIAANSTGTFTVLAGATLIAIKTQNV